MNLLAADTYQNWNKWQKYKAYLTLCIFASLATANAIKFTIAPPQLSNDFGLSVLDIKSLTAFNVLALGIGNLSWVPLTRLLGKRPIVLLSLPTLVAANIWSSQTQRYDQLLASSVLSGFASAAALCIGPVVVADLSYVHERAAAMMWFFGVTFKWIIPRDIHQRLGGSVLFLESQLLLDRDCSWIDVAFRHSCIARDKLPWSKYLQTTSCLRPKEESLAENGNHV